MPRRPLAAATIYDMLGQLILQNQIRQQTTTISLSDRAAGVHALTISNTTIPHTIRFTVVK